MASTEQLRRFYQFDEFKFFPEELLIECEGKSAHLRDSSKKVLKVLIEHRPRFLSATVLLNEVWSQGELSNVYHAIGDLKKLFGDKYIENEKGSGYRFAATDLKEGYESTDKRIGVAVLIFHDPQRLDSEKNYPLAFGIADALISRLAKTRQLIVRPTNSIAKYAPSKERDIAAIGRELRVDRILDGNFTLDGKSVMLNPQLIDVQHNSVIWGKQFIGNLVDLDLLETRMSEQVASTLIVNLSPQEHSQITTADTKSSQAYDLYRQGRFHWHKSVIPELKTAIKFFQQALEIDNSYARAYAGIADAYTLLAWFGKSAPKEVFPKVKEYATKALDLGEVPEAHTSLAAFLECYDRNIREAERHYREAIARHPNYDIGHQAYGDCLARLGRFDEAHEQYDRALDIHPYSPFTNAMKAWAYVFEQRPNEAIRQATIALDYNKDYFLAYLVIGEGYQLLKNYDDAVIAIQKAVNISGGHVFARTWLAIAQILAGRSSIGVRTCEALLEKLQHEYVPPYFIALIYAALRKNDEAFDWLEKAYKLRDPYFNYSKVEIYFKDEFRSIARFDDLLSRSRLLSSS